MTTRSATRPRAAAPDADALRATVDGFLDRFASPATVDRWRGWSDAARAATTLRHLHPRSAGAERALRRWERFQATHGDL